MRVVVLVFDREDLDAGFRVLLFADLLRADVVLRAVLPADCFCAAAVFFPVPLPTVLPAVLAADFPADVPADFPAAFPADFVAAGFGFAGAAGSFEPTRFEAVAFLPSGGFRPVRLSELEADCLERAMVYAWVRGQRGTRYEDRQIARRRSCAGRKV